MILIDNQSTCRGFETFHILFQQPERLCDKPKSKKIAASDPTKKAAAITGYFFIIVSLPGLVDNTRIVNFDRDVKFWRREIILIQYRSGCDVPFN